MIDDQAIREAIGAIADDAHPPQQIRAAVTARYRRHRQRRVLLRIAGATAAASVAGAGGYGVYRFTRPDEGGFPLVAGGPGGGWLRVAPRWRPGWLPEGLGQTHIGVVVEGGATVSVGRTWSSPPGSDGLSQTVEVLTGWSSAYAGEPKVARTEPADVHGVRGECWFIAEGGVRLGWQPAGADRLTVQVFLDGDPDRERTVALRVAKALRPDPGTITVGPRPGWLPAAFSGRPWMVTLAAVDGMWRQGVVVRDGPHDIDVTMGPRTDEMFRADGARQVRAHGTDARLSSDGHMLSVPTPDGFEAVVRHDTGTEAELIRIVDEFTFGPVPDMTWYGGR